MEGAAAEGGVGGGGPGGGSGGGGLPPPFLSKTYDMVDDASTDGVVSWSSGNNSFVVWNVAEFSKELLPKYFKHSNFSSFVRQLNTYGFRKADPDRWEFANEGFLRGKKYLLKTINRRKAPHVNSPAPQIQTAAVGACIEVGKFGLEEEVERLKRDKNLLMQELVRLKQQQQSTDHQLQTVGSHVQMMEQRQQQMMSFLAKAMQSPGFMSQLVQQQNESSRRITNSSKKRRLPNQDEPVFRTYGDRTPDGQVTKYQPLLNEAAASMLRQILNMNVSAQRETSLWKPDAFLIDECVSTEGNFLMNGVARGCGWQKIGAFINLGSYYLVGIPFAILLAFVLHIGGKGLWMGIICALVVQVMSLAIVTVRTDWEQEAKKATERVKDSMDAHLVVS